MNNVWFQQDDATPHTWKILLEWLFEKFGEHFISLRSNIEWQPHSPDLTPSDFFLWDYLKDRVYSPPHKTRVLWKCLFEEKSDV